MMNRGDRREPIFKDDADRGVFWTRWGKRAAKRAGRKNRNGTGGKRCELGRRRKGDPAKVAIAGRLRKETTMTLEWIAKRLNMGTKTHLAHLFYWQRRTQ